MKDSVRETQRTSRCENYDENVQLRGNTAEANASALYARVQFLIVIKLFIPNLHHMQDNLRILRLIFVPAVASWYASAR